MFTFEGKTIRRAIVISHPLGQRTFEEIDSLENIPLTKFKNRFS